MMISDGYESGEAEQSESSDDFSMDEATEVKDEIDQNDLRCQIILDEKQIKWVEKILDNPSKIRDLQKQVLDSPNFYNVG